MPSRINSTISASSTQVKDTGMPVLTCMVTEPAEISAMNSAAITIPTGCRLPSMATTMPLKPKSPATPSINRRVLPLI